MSLNIKQLLYEHPNKELLLENISFSILKGEKVALIGDNGIGKSTLLKIIAGKLTAKNGEVLSSETPYYIPQHFGQYDELTVSEALSIDKKLDALNKITEGDISVENFDLLDDDWGIEERALTALSFWDIPHIQFDQKMDTLSGGEKTKVFLSGINIHSPAIILMDEPTNHLDRNSRKQVCDFIKNSLSTIIIVSHDRHLLNLLSFTLELTKSGIEKYSGNYELYKEQKQEKILAIQQQLNEKEKELRKAKKIAREAIERQEKHSTRGGKASIKKGIPRIALGGLKNQSENSTSKLKNTHEEKTNNLFADIKEIQQKLSDKKEMKVSFENSELHKGKILITAKNINFSYNNIPLWDEALSFQIRSGDRCVIHGKNGSGKTTLIKLLLGSIEPTDGIITRADFSSVYIDQEYSIIENNLTVLEQVEKYNDLNYPDHELKTFLHRFQFTYNTWGKKCSQLSGGEKMKLAFCCFQISNKMPDIFALDEPTNNLDIQSMDIVTSVIKSYQGTVILISHDEYFVREIEINKEILLEK